MRRTEEGRSRTEGGWKGEYNERISTLLTRWPFPRQLYYTIDTCLDHWNFEIEREKFDFFISKNSFVKVKAISFSFTFGREHEILLHRVSKIAKFPFPGKIYNVTSSFAHPRFIRVDLPLYFPLPLSKRSVLNSIKGIYIYIRKAVQQCFPTYIS